MKKKFKKMVAIGGIAITLFGAGTGIATSMLNSKPAEAKTQKQDSIKNIKAKRNAKISLMTLNKKGTKVIKVTAMKRGPYVVKGAKTHAYWQFMYKKHNYYYLGGRYVARASDFAKIKSVDKLTNLVKRAQKAQIAQIANSKAYKEKQKNWEDKLDAARVKTISAKTNQKTTYWELNKDTQQSQKEMDMGEKIQIMFVQKNALKQGDNSFDAYYALYNNKQIVIPAESVTLDDKNQKVLDSDEYKKAVDNFNTIYKNAQSDLKIGNK